jgi:hypothetical protein
VSLRREVKYALSCNGRMVTPGISRPCPRVFEVPGLVRHPPPADLRRAAAAAGWVHVRSRLSRRLDRDYCPGHCPAPPPGAHTHGDGR